MAAASIRLTFRSPRRPRSCSPAFYNRHGEEQAELTGALASAWSKLAAYAGRLALVLHLTNWAAEQDEIDPATIDAASMGCAIRLVEWFKIEARRVYATLAADEADQDRQALAELLRRQGKPITARDLAKLSSRYGGDSEAAEEALEDLAKCGFGKWETQGSERPRRTTHPPLCRKWRCRRNPRQSRGKLGFGYADAIESVNNENCQSIKEG